MTWAADEDSEAALDRLADLIGDQEISLLTGAGLSRRLGYPLWRQLLGQMSHEVARSKDVTRQAARNAREVANTVQGLPPDVPQDLTWLAEYYAELLGEERYVQFLKGVFGAPPQKNPAEDPCYEALIRLPFQNILTFNYDDTLRAAHDSVCGTPAEMVEWTDAAQVRSFLLRSRAPGGKRRFVHLHGSLQGPVILRNADYAQRYVISREGEERLFLLFSTHKLLFVGCSLEDAPVLSALQAVQYRLGTRETNHFAILSERKGTDLKLERRRLTTRFGVSPLFYREDQHHLLEDLLRDLTARLQTRGGWPQPQTDASPVSEQPWILGPVRVADDPQKGRFGGQAERNGRNLSATVDGTEGRYRILATVSSTASGAPLEGKVVFYLHDTFSQAVRHVRVKNGKAQLELIAYGAFTMGALADGGVTALELDLSENPKYPTLFRQS